MMIRHISLLGVMHFLQDGLYLAKLTYKSCKESHQAKQNSNKDIVMWFSVKQCIYNISSLSCRLTSKMSATGIAFKCKGVVHERVMLGCTSYKVRNLYQERKLCKIYPFLFGFRSSANRGIKIGKINL